MESTSTGTRKRDENMSKPENPKWSARVPAAVTMLTENQIEEELSPTMIANRDAFERELPELMAKHSGQWAAFYEGKLIAVGLSQADAYRKCKKNQNIESSDLLVRKIRKSSPIILDREDYELGV